MDVTKPAFHPRLTTRVIVRMAAIAALYATATLILAPISYGPIQLRVANLLKPLVLYDPALALGFGMGTFIANLGSPFGLFDIAIMPVVDILAGLVAWKLRRVPAVAVLLQATIISLGVSIFPLGMGGRLPFWLTFPGVLASNAAVIFFGWLLIWRNYGWLIGRHTES